MVARRRGRRAEGWTKVLRSREDAVEAAVIFAIGLFESAPSLQLIWPWMLVSPSWYEGESHLSDDVSFPTHWDCTHFGLQDVSASVARTSPEPQSAEVVPHAAKGHDLSRLEVTAFDNNTRDTSI